MSLRTLQAETGLNRGYLSRVERGLIRQPAPTTVLTVASALRVPPDAITHEETP
ncbi:MAG: helix-turn-helix transcriptional regulator [Nocardiopsaceae bacterium]|nr:helix-turn-helix transcriptional regulator [Nocardiopsaceae bacterium]